MRSATLNMHRNCFGKPQNPLGELSTFPKTLVGWGEGRSLPILRPLDLGAFAPNTNSWLRDYTPTHPISKYSGCATDQS